MPFILQDYTGQATANGSLSAAKETKVCLPELISAMLMKMAKCINLL
jgi:hypothetical protein